MIARKNFWDAQLEAADELKKELNKKQKKSK